MNVKKIKNVFKINTPRKIYPTINKKPTDI